MQYNYYYEIASVVFMLLIFFVLLINRNFELSKGRSFFALVIASMIESCMNVASSWGLANTDIVSSTLNWWLCFIFFLGEAFTSVLFFRYVVILCEASRAKRTRYAIFALVPLGIFLFMIITSKPFKLIYSVENNVYSQGPMAWYGYFYIILWVIVSLWVAIRTKSMIRGKNRFAIIVAILISAAAIIVQFNIKETILTGIANAIIIYIFYILIENPNELRDKISSVRNARAFSLKFENIQTQEKSMSILAVDIHQQSQLNALFGYRNGNIILAEVGEFLAGVAGKNNVFHISENEFAIVEQNDELILQYKEIILEQFEHRWNLEGVDTMVMVNLARFRFPEDVNDINEFYGLWSYIKPILRQDIMKNYMELTPDIKDCYRRTNEVEKALDYAIKNKSIQVYFQPIYDTKKKCFTSLEALARMFDDKLGFVAPDEFIAQAEINGTVIPLELIILEKTCEFIEKELLPRKDQITIESVHVNVSVQQCMQQNMDEVFLDIIDRHNVPRSMIMLEITERATVTAPELMKKHMTSLKEKGVLFALDDYGTGNANCSYLIEYPFAKAKFEKGMVWAYFESETGKIVLDGEMQTIHKLHIPIVAEGIETREQLEEMEAMGVEQVQGYYFSKPVSMNEIIKVIS